MTGAEAMAAAGAALRSASLVDGHGRAVDYLRLSRTSFVRSIVSVVSIVSRNAMRVWAAPS